MLKPSVDLGGVPANGSYATSQTQAAAGSGINAVDIDWNGADLGLIEKDVRSNDGIGRTQRVYS